VCGDLRRPSSMALAGASPKADTLLRHSPATYDRVASSGFSFVVLLTGEDVVGFIEHHQVVGLGFQ
jgi:hypothetical protein